LFVNKFSLFFYLCNNLICLTRDQYHTKVVLSATISQGTFAIYKNLNMKKYLLALVLFCFATSSFAQLSKDLVAWYPLTVNANDSSGNGNNGYIHSGVTSTTDRFGHADKAFFFNGTDSGFISCNNDSQLLKSRNFSCSFWFNVHYRTSGWQQNVMISNVGPYQASGGFEVVTNNPTPPNSCVFLYRDSADQDKDYGGTLPVDSVTWYNYIGVLRYDSIKDTTTITNYLNGAPDDSTKFRGAIWYYNISPFYIGTNYDQFGCCQRAFLGTISDVMLWTRALGVSDVTGITSGVKPTNLPANKLSLYPNPSTGNFLIQGLPVSNDNATIEVMNALGQVVYSEQVASSDKIQMNLAGAAPGLYFVQVIYKANSYTMKWVKE
jgi:hypothetical protein